jgi:archaellum biogenesis ATPase FlaH
MIQVEEQDFMAAVANGTAGKIKPHPGIRFKKVPIPFDIETLDNFIAFAYDVTSAHITRAALINLHSLVQMVNVNVYKRNQGIKARINFLDMLLTARLAEGLNNRKLMLSYAMEHCDNPEMIREEVVPEINQVKLNSRAVHHLNLKIADKLTNGFAFGYQEAVFKMYEDLEASNYTSIREWNQGFKQLLIDMLHDIRTSENFNDEMMTLDLSDGNFESVAKVLIERLQSPRNRLQTGSQAINELLGGGFEAARAFLFFGLPGVGKSVVLLNICEWLRNHNKVVPKDPTARPAILYITQENSLAETLERLFNMTVTADELSNYTPEEVVHLLRTKGGFKLTTKDDIDFIIKYYDDKEISTVDIYSIIEDIEDTGREVIALVHDYIERIRSSANLPDLRLELAQVANDYAVLSKRLQIPVIGAGQINRKGSDTIDSQVEGNRTDVIRSLGRGAISESWAMLKNLDAAFFVHREEDTDGNEYMCFLKIKFRGKSGKFKKKNKKKMFESYVAHPFDPENGIKLMDDIHLAEPLSRITLDDNMNENVTKKNRSMRERKELPTNQRQEQVIEVQSDTVNFNTIEESFRIRKRMENKTAKVSDESAAVTFEKVFAENTKGAYVRDTQGRIVLSFIHDRHRQKQKEMVG